MIKTIVLVAGLACVLALASALADHEQVVSDSLLADVSSKTSLWKAAHNHLTKLPVSEIKKLLSVGGIKRPSAYEIPAELEAATKIGMKALPENFDSRQQWPTCIHPIRDQEKCGSCWAFSASEVLSDRFCIASKGATNVVLSPQAMVSCDQTDMGCNGGMLNNAWAFLSSTGIPTDACMPYTSGGGDSGTCPTKCADGSAIKNYKATNAKHVSSLFFWKTPALIQEELQANGPVQAAFEVYQDFISYSTGVYHHVSGSLLGGHAVKIVGWGVESNTPYWLVANSWNTNWGEQGFFKIKRGDNECGFEANIWEGQPLL